jgi:hypothetical protein
MWGRRLRAPAPVLFGRSSKIERLEKLSALPLWAGSVVRSAEDRGFSGSGEQPLDVLDEQLAALREGDHLSAVEVVAQRVGFGSRR